MIELPRELEKTFAEFFAGVGLMRLGLERAGGKSRMASAQRSSTAAEDE
jgi:hypothetical protein